MELVFKAILDRTNMASGLKAIEGQVQAFSGKIKNLGIMDAIGTELSAAGKVGVGGLMSSLGALAGVGAAIGAGFGVAMHAVGGFVELLGKGLEQFEKYEEATLQIARFTGSMEEARQKMEEFDKLGEELSTPDEQLADAYQTLRLIGGEAMASAENIRLIADASAAGRGGVEELARAFAIVQSSIESGEGTGKWGTKLARMGVISFEAKEAIDQLSKSVETQGQALAIFEKEWGKFSGSAEAKGRTFSGAMLAVKDATGDLLRVLAEPIAGPLGNIFRDLANLLTELEPITKVVGSAIGFLLAIVNTATTGFMGFVDSVSLVRDAIKGLITQDWSGFDERMERMGKRMENLGRGWRSVFTGSMEGDKVTKMNQGNYDVDEGATQEKIKNIAKLKDEINKIRSKTDEIGMSSEEKKVKLLEEQKQKNDEIAQAQQSLQALQGKDGRSGIEEKILELQKEEAQIAQDIKKITQDTIDAKMKSAEAESKKSQEIYDHISEGQKKRQFNESNPVEKLKMNASERSDLEKQRAELLGQFRNENNRDISNPTDNADSMAIRAELTRKMAEIDSKIADNKYQEQDVIKTQADDYTKAKGETQDYNTKRLFDQMRQDYGNDEDNKKAIELEKEFHKTRISQLEDEAKKLEETGDLGGAERMRLKAQQEKDAIKDLDYDKRVNKGTQTMDGGQFAGSLAGSLMGIQYDNSGQEQVKHLGTIAELTKATNEAVKLVADNTGKPVVISRFT